MILFNYLANLAHSVLLLVHITLILDCSLSQEPSQDTNGIQLLNSVTVMMDNILLSTASASRRPRRYTLTRRHPNSPMPVKLDPQRPSTLN